MARSNVSKFVKYTAEVDDMQAAWTFVMGYVDLFDRPDIEIKAVTIFDTDKPEDEWVEKYTVVIYGEERGDKDAE